MHLNKVSYFNFIFHTEGTIKFERYGDISSALLNLCIGKIRALIYVELSGLQVITNKFHVSVIFVFWNRN